MPRASEFDASDFCLSHPLAIHKTTTRPEESRIFCSQPSVSVAQTSKFAIPRQDQLAGIEMRSVDVRSTPGGMKRVEGFRPTSPKAWEAMSRALRRTQVKTLKPSQVAGGSGWNRVLVDVRPREDYQEAHIAGTVNVPLYQPIAGWSPQQILRRAGYAFFGVAKGTEANPTFMEEFKSAVGPNWKEVVMICETGGTLQVTGNFPNGKQSRSLIACYEVLLEGYKRLSFLEGGMNEYSKSGLPLEELAAEKNGPFIF